MPPLGFKERDDCSQLFRQPVGFSPGGNNQLTWQNLNMHSDKSECASIMHPTAIDRPMPTSDLPRLCTNATPLTTCSRQAETLGGGVAPADADVHQKHTPISRKRAQPSCSTDNAIVGQTIVHSPATARHRSFTPHKPTTQKPALDL